MRSKKQHIVPAMVNRQRISDYLPSIFPLLATKSGVKKAIKKQLVKIDGNVASTANWVKSGQEIELFEDNSKTQTPYKLKLEVCYEDDYLAIINKPAGIVVSGNRFKTIENALLFNIKPSTKEDALPSPRPVHRLDGGTSGLLLVAKTKSAQIYLHEEFEKKRIKKFYHAIVIGKLDEELHVYAAIDGQIAETRVQPIQHIQSIGNEYITLIEALPKTGRTHQIRIHLNSIGHPIMGDKIYSEKGKHIKGKGMFLCAIKLELKHPESQKLIKVCITPPKKFDAFMNSEKKRFENFRTNKKLENDEA